MKVCVIGDSNSIFIKQFIEYVLLDDPGNQIILIEENSTNPDYIQFYKENGVFLENRINKCNRITAKIPKIRSTLGNYLWCKYILKKYGTFDLVHVHGLNYSRGNVGLYLRKSTQKLAITVWGDELFRADKKMLRHYRKYYDAADCITVSTSDMHRDFLTAYGHRYDKVLHMNKFAVGILDRIDEVRNTYGREMLCKEFGIPDPNKLLVFMGHNGRPAQRHGELTKALEDLPQELKEQITLVYTMTYGVPNQSYLDNLTTRADTLGCSYVVLREFMNETTTAKLRSICDIMLHAQLTDAFSASLCESLYAGAVILNGSWLVYNDLPDCHQRFVEYDSMEEIPQKLSDVIHNYADYKEKASQNQAVIRSICSKEITTQRWKESLIKNGL